MGSASCSQDLKQRILEAVTSPTAPSQREALNLRFPVTNRKDLDIQNSLIFVKADPDKQMPISEYVKDDTLGKQPHHSPEALGTGLLLRNLSMPSAIMRRREAKILIAPDRNYAARPILWSRGRHRDR
jgi:hypothetical protein